MYRFLAHKFLERQSHKMVKHTKTICRQFADELFECVYYFVGWRLKGSFRPINLDHSIYWKLSSKLIIFLVIMHAQRRNYFDLKRKFKI